MWFTFGGQALVLLVYSHRRCNMAAIAFDPLEYTHELEASGVPRAQAEVHAKAMTARFIHNFDALVTTDYLDTRLSELETRFVSQMDTRFVAMDAKFEQRFAEMDAKFEKRFLEMDAKFDKRFTDMDAKFDKRLAGIDAQFDQGDAKFDMRFASFQLEMNGKFSELGSTVKVQSWMLGIIVAAVLYPFLQQLLTWG